MDIKCNFFWVLIVFPKLTLASIIASNSWSSSLPLNQWNTSLHSLYLPLETSQLGDSGVKSVIMRLMKGRKRQTRTVLRQLKIDPTRWTKKTPKPWVRDMVVRKAPLFFGLVYSPMRVERRVSIMPTDKPPMILPRRIIWNSQGIPNEYSITLVEL